MTAPALMTTRQHEATQFLRCYACPFAILPEYADPELAAAW